MNSYIKKYKGYTHKPKYPPTLVKIMRIVVIELFVLIVGITFEFLGKNIDDVTTINNSNMLILAYIMPFLLVFYYFYLKDGVSGRYNAATRYFHHDIAVISDKQQRKFKALVILEIKDITQKIIVKEERIRKKTIEKLAIPGTFQYIHYHLTILAKIFPNISYEIRVKQNNIIFRILFSLISNDKDKLVEEIGIFKNVAKYIFQTTFPGINIELLQGAPLISAWEDIFGGWGEFNYKIKNNAMVIERIQDKQFMAILQMNKPPSISNIESAAQIDHLIRNIMGLKFDFNFVVSSESSQIYNFLGESPGDELPEFLVNEENIRAQLQVIRYSESTALWNVSSYIVVHSHDQKTLDEDIQAIKTIFSTVFGTELTVLCSQNLKKAVARIAMRSPLPDWLNLTSEQLAILFHFPELNSPSAHQSDIPNFEIPSEKMVSDGIPIGKILLDTRMIYPLHLSLEALRLNVVVTGQDGMGKSHLVLNILKKLMENNPEINWIAFDIKGEYIQLKDSFPDDIKILTPDSLEINLFNPLDENRDEHARKLLALFQELFPDVFSIPHAEKICLEILKRVINQSKSRNLKGFLAELSGYSSEIYGENKPSKAINALIKCFNQLEGTIFEVERSNIDFSQVFERKTILNLAPLIANGKIVEYQLLANITLKYLIDHILRSEFAESLKFLFIIEDAHLISHSILHEVPETNFISDLPRLLPKFGVGLISISPYPDHISSILESSKTKIIFRLSQYSKVISLRKDQEQFLQNQPKREAFVSLPHFSSPFRIYTDYIDLTTVRNPAHNSDFKENTLIPKQEVPKELSSIKREEAQKSTEIFQEYEKNIQLLNDGCINSSKLEEKLSFSYVSDSERISPLETTLNQVKNYKINHFSPTKLLLLLKNGPASRKNIAEYLVIPENEVVSYLRPYLNQKVILKTSSIIKEQFLLPEHIFLFADEIKARLKYDCAESGILRPLMPEDTFDFIASNLNGLIKVLSGVETMTELPEKILKLLEKTLERKYSQLILIAPFLEQAEIIRSWLEKFNIKNIVVFANTDKDWESLIAYLNNT